MPLTDSPPTAPPAIEQSAIEKPGIEQSGAADFDLGQVARKDGAIEWHMVRRDCLAAKPGEIVVCAPDPAQDRLLPLRGDYAVEAGLPRAETGIGPGTTLGVEAQSAALANGMTATRVMVGIKLKF
ncbi:hypothetical protein WSK_2396 [Novosphingobium sp. Rr 2-17]|uniref:hypothetical protein n=1 Tax=Novosphingobium sp. Rr 2-17 TaxID=555793 RepID=UPI000269A51B|nr:hypothetical protein [Novosphingobium sp. Rr 2-17]EIZ78853.1 hypothetical protein WSK_2396 [Novosphingobium sp. Rr 2-17]